MNSLAAAAAKVSKPETKEKKSSRVRDAIKAWQRCPQAWRVKMVGGDKPTLEKMKESAIRADASPDGNINRTQVRQRMTHGPACCSPSTRI